MTAYIPALVWLISAFACLGIARQRHVKTSTMWAMLVTLIGPFAIPLVMLAKPEPSHPA